MAALISRTSSFVRLIRSPWESGRSSRPRPLICRSGSGFRPLSQLQHLCQATRPTGRDRDGSASPPASTTCPGAGSAEPCTRLNPPTNGSSRQTTGPADRRAPPGAVSQGLARFRSVPNSRDRRNLKGGSCPNTTTGRWTRRFLHPRRHHQPHHLTPHLLRLLHHQWPKGLQVLANSVVGCAGC